MSPFDAFNDGIQLDIRLMEIIRQHLRKGNAGREALGKGVENKKDNRVLRYEYDKIDRGCLGNLAPRWSEPFVPGAQFGLNHMENGALNQISKEQIYSSHCNCFDQNF